jgi:hypothetical protein
MCKPDEENKIAKVPVLASSPRTAAPSFGVLSCIAAHSLTVVETPIVDP